MTLSVRYSAPFVSAAVVACIRSRISTILAAFAAEADGALSCPSSLPSFAVQFGDDRMPQPHSDWVRVLVNLVTLRPTSSIEEGIATYRVTIEAKTVDQTLAAVPSALPGGDPTPDADVSVITSSGIRAQVIAEAAARSLEGFATSDVPGCYGINRSGDGPFVPKEAVAFGYRMIVELTCRSTWPTGV